MRLFDFKKETTQDWQIIADYLEERNDDRATVIREWIAEGRTPEELALGLGAHCEETATWKTGNGISIPISNMGISHIQNALRYFRNQTISLRRQFQLRLLELRYESLRRE